MEAPDSSLTGLVEAVPEPFALVGVDFRFIAFNRSYSDLFWSLFGVRLVPGMDRRALEAVFPPEQRGLDLEGWRQALAGEALCARHRLGDPARRLSWRGVRYHAVRAPDGQVIAACGLSRELGATGDPPPEPETVGAACRRLAQVLPGARSACAPRPLAPLRVLPCAGPRVTPMCFRWTRIRAERALAQALTNLRELLQARGASLKVQPLPAVDFDEHNLVRVFQQLLEAVLRHGPARPRIEISARPQPGCWVFSIRASGGVGLEWGGWGGDDLALCSRLLSRQGGRLWMESGTRPHIRFSVPQRVEDQVA